MGVHTDAYEAQAPDDAMGLYDPKRSSQAKTDAFIEALLLAEAEANWKDAKEWKNNETDLESD